MKEPDANACVPSKDEENQLRCAQAEADGSSKEAEKTLNDIEKWKRNQKEELRYNINQTHELLKLKEAVEGMVKDLEKPSNITQENIYSRESCPPAESGKDYVGETLTEELSTFRFSKRILKDQIQKLMDQLTKLRAVRQELEIDIQKKRGMKKTDECVKLLCALRKEIGGGIEIPESKPTKQLSSTWLAKSKDLIKNSQVERDAGRILHTQVNRVMLSCSNQCFSIWYETNDCFRRAIKEISADIQHIQELYCTTCSEIQDLDIRIKEIWKKLEETMPALHFTKARVEKRVKQPGIELCQDKVAMNLLRELHTHQMEVDKLKAQLNGLKTMEKELRNVKRLQEKNIRLKNMSLFVHHEKCLLLRQNLLISTFKNARYPHCSFIPSSFERGGCEYGGGCL